MKGAQYKRLLLVMILPLLIAGVIFTKIAIRPDDYASIKCLNDTIFGENCRVTDGLGKKWDEQLKSQSPAWFDIYIRSYEKNKLPYAIVSGSQRSISNVIVTSVDPYVGTYDGAGSYVEYLRNMIGQDVSIIFGNNEDTILLNHLGCNELNISQSGDVHSAGLCGVPNGIVRLGFRSEGESKEFIDNLRLNLNGAIYAERVNIIIDWTVGTLLPLILFLFGSLLIFIIRKAFSYVKSG